MKGELTLLTKNCADQTCDCFKNVLFSFAAIDNDFNGANGPEYLWSEAKTAGFKSNAEYAWSVAKQESEARCDDEWIFKRFISMWMGSDLYYRRYVMSVVRDENDMISAVSLAFVTNN